MYLRGVRIKTSCPADPWTVRVKIGFSTTPPVPALGGWVGNVVSPYFVTGRTGKRNVISRVCPSGSACRIGMGRGIPHAPLISSNQLQWWTLGLGIIN